MSQTSLFNTPEPEKSFEDLIAEESGVNLQKENIPETEQNGKLPELILIDTSGILFKQYEGRKSAAEKDPKRWGSWFAKHPSGQGVVNVDAIAGYLNFFEKQVLSSFGADRIIHVLDTKNGSSSRKKLYPEYKSHRKPKAEEFKWQDSIMGDALLSMGQIIAYADEHEADDVIGTLARQWIKNKKGKVLIISYDKDMTQLVSETNDDDTPSIAQASFNAPQWVIYSDNESVYKKMGVLPVQIADFLALCGDAADGIPGINGIGETKAAALLNEYGTIETLIKNQDEIPKKLGENLRAGSHLLPLFKQLTTIRQYLKEDEATIYAPHKDASPKGIEGWLHGGKPFPLTGKDYTIGAVYPEVADKARKEEREAKDALRQEKALAKESKGTTLKI